MKQFSLASILCGTLLVLAPIIHDLITLAMLTHLLALDPKGDYHLHGALESSYQGWCLFLGACLFIVGVVGGFKSRGGRTTSPAADVLPPAIAGNDA